MVLLLPLVSSLFLLWSLFEVLLENVSIFNYFKKIFCMYNVFIKNYFFINAYLPIDRSQFTLDCFMLQLADDHAVGTQFFVRAGNYTHRLYCHSIHTNNHFK